MVHIVQSKSVDTPPSEFTGLGPGTKYQVSVVAVYETGSADIATARDLWTRELIAARHCVAL